MATKSMLREPKSRAVLEGWFERFRHKLPVPTERRTVHTRAGDTHVLVGGPESGPPLVLLHGALASSAHALVELHPLLMRFRVFSVDVLGQSVMSADVRPAVSGAAAGEWLRDVLDALGLEKPFVVGVSWGGFIAHRLAALAPERIAKLVLLVPAGMVKGPAFAGLVKLGFPMMAYRRSPSEAKLRKFVGNLLTTTDDDWVPYLGDAFQNFSLDMRIPPLAKKEELAGFHAPTLVIGADRDLSFPGDKLVRRAAELFDSPETEVLAGSRHCPPTTDAFRRYLAERIERFLLPA